ncbi:MAG: hypothetical protein IPP07_11840 [Holophagales bacterium]|nr:hypothetical protein [Holophagales bacterium]
MVRGWRLLAACLLVAGVADGEGFRLNVGGFVDLRAARTDETTGWLEGGLGKLRWGGEDGEPKTVLALAQSAVVFRASLGEELRAYAHLNVDTGSYPASGLAGLDLVEGWLSYRPRLSSSIGLRLRGGHFFPPLSLENDGIAWSPTRTLTASALDSWIGEEVRVTGLEASLEFFLATSDLTFTGAVFGGNDPCGSLLAWRGWAIGDRQSGISDRLPLAALPAFEPGGIFPAQDPWVAPFREVDGRAGWYAAASYVLPEHLEVRTLLYDNRGDPLALEDGQYAWKTRFAAVGAKLQLSRGVEVLGQYLDGWSVMGPEEAVDAYYRTWYLLASATWGAHRLSARYDWFRVRDEDRYGVVDPNDEEGDAWTVAWSFEFDRRTSVLLELLSVDSTRPARGLVGLPERARETLVQVGVRGRF